MLKSVIKFIFDNIGNITSSNKVANTMTSLGRKISTNTVESYLSALTDSFVFYEVTRFDIKGKQHLKTRSKYYACDVALRYALLGSKPSDLGHILENDVNLELLRRYNEVFIGKVYDTEVDFVITTETGFEFYQVAYTVKDPKTLQRELKPLEMIKDSNLKFLLTTDYSPPASHNGIRQLNVYEGCY